MSVSVSVFGKFVAKHFGVAKKIFFALRANSFGFVSVSVSVAIVFGVFVINFFLRFAQFVSILLPCLCL